MLEATSLRDLSFPPTPSLRHASCLALAKATTTTTTMCCKLCDIMAHNVISRSRNGGTGVAKYRATHLGTRGGGEGPQSMRQPVGLHLGTTLHTHRRQYFPIHVPLSRRPLKTHATLTDDPQTKQKRTSRITYASPDPSNYSLVGLA